MLFYCHRQLFTEFPHLSSTIAYASQKTQDQKRGQWQWMLYVIFMSFRDWYRWNSVQILISFVRSNLIGLKLNFLNWQISKLWKSFLSRNFNLLNSLLISPSSIWFGAFLLFIWVGCSMRMALVLLWTYYLHSPFIFIMNQLSTILVQYLTLAAAAADAIVYLI